MNDVFNHMQMKTMIIQIPTTKGNGQMGNLINHGVSNWYPCFDTLKCLIVCVRSEKRVDITGTNSFQAADLMLNF